MLAAALPLGPFLIDEAGRLRLRTPGLKPCFSFVWRGRRFMAALNGGQVSVSATLARVPSTATLPTAREPAFAALRAIPGGLPPHWKLSLAPDHRVQIEADEPMDWPASAAALMQPLVHILLRLGPCLDLLEEAGLTHSGQG